LTYKCAKYLAKILSPLTGKTDHHINNTKQFVDKISNVILSDNEVVTSYDVSALFTAVPPDDALQVTKKYLLQDKELHKRTPLKPDHIIELLELCLKTTYFSYKDKYYIQKHGCAMGSPVSPIIVNLYMEDFEKKALTSYPGTAPRYWLRYVDDTFVIIDANELPPFFEHLNTIDDNIKFTQEQCTDHCMPFLDCLVSIQNNKLQTKVYRKPTHTDQYLAFDSNHPLSHKLSVIRTLQHRANTIISLPSEIEEEHKSVKRALGTNGYPSWAFLKVDQLSRQVRPQRDTNQTKGQGTQVLIPYVRGVSERLRKAFKRQGVNVIHKPTNNLRSKLKTQEPIDIQSNIVYNFKCGQEECNASCIGETKQALKGRHGSK
jgi:hypothetical protein